MQNTDTLRVHLARGSNDEASVVETQELPDGWRGEPSETRETHTQRHGSLPGAGARRMAFPKSPCCGARPLYRREAVGGVEGSAARCQRADRWWVTEHLVRCVNPVPALSNGLLHRI